MFNYKVLNNHKCGFPDTVIEKVIEKLENERISYQIIYVDKDSLEKNFKKLNKYEKYYDLAIKTVGLTKRIDILIEKIKTASDEEIEEIIRRIESCLK